MFASQLAYVVTLTGIISAVLLLGECYALTVWLAVGLMLAGVTLVKPIKVVRSPETPVAV